MAVPFIALAVSLLLFFGFLLLLYRLLRWLWWRLPFVLPADLEPLDRLIGILAALLLFPELPEYAWSTIESLFKIFPKLITDIANLRVTTCEYGSDFVCLSDAVAKLQVFFVNSGSQLLAALKFSSFPIVSFVWFLLTVIILSQLVAYIRRRFDAGSLARSVMKRVRRAPKQLWPRLVFTALVVVSFYLGLSALLAIPVLQDKSRGALTSEQLIKAIDSISLTKESFDASYPVALPVPPEVPEPQVSEDRASVLDSMWQAGKKQREDITDNLQQSWTFLRTAAFNKQSEISNVAKDLVNFTSSGATRKQFDKYYSDLYAWHREAIRSVRTRITECHNAAVKYLVTSNQVLDQFRLAIQQERPPVIKTIDGSFENARTVYPIYENAVFACRQLSDGDLPPTPSRPAVGDLLGPVGVWTSWVVDPELMPIVIITGLVGFSLLGATVSRAVRVQDERRKTTLTLNDLLIVIAGGTTAAIVVFLAAYGGLALLGSSGGDPNPYVVFATCLVGAVFSEDVWKWARRKFSVSQQEEDARKREAEKVPPSKAPPVVNAPKTGTLNRGRKPRSTRT